MWAIIKALPSIIAAIPQIISFVRDIFGLIDRWRRESAIKEADKRIEQERSERLKAVEGAKSDDEFDEAVRDSLR